MPYREVPPINCDTSTRLPCLQRSPFRVGSYITWQSQVPQATVSTRHWLWVTESLTTGVIKQSLLPRIPYGSYLPTAHESHELGPSPTSAATCSSDFFTPAAVAPHLTIRTGSIPKVHEWWRVVDVSYPKSATGCACMQKGLILIPSNHDYSIWWFQGYCSNMFLIISRHIKTQDSMIFKQLAAK